MLFYFQMSDFPLFSVDSFPNYLGKCQVTRVFHQTARPATSQTVFLVQFLVSTAISRIMTYLEPRDNNLERTKCGPRHSNGLPYRSEKNEASIFLWTKFKVYNFVRCVPKVNFNSFKSTLIYIHELNRKLHDQCIEFEIEFNFSFIF